MALGGSGGLVALELQPERFTERQLHAREARDAHAGRSRVNAVAPPLQEWTRVEGHRCSFRIWRAKCVACRWVVQAPSNANRCVTNDGRRTGHHSCPDGCGPVELAHWCAFRTCT